MERNNRIYAIIGFVSTLCGFLAKAFYRDYINMNGLEDYGFAGFLPSYFYVMGFSQLLLIRPAQYPLLVIMVVTFASIVFEFMQIRTYGNLDMPDIFASFMGGITSYIVLKLVSTH